MINSNILNQLLAGNNPLQGDFEHWKQEKIRYKKLKFPGIEVSSEKESHQKTLNKIYALIANQYDSNDLNAFAMWLDIKGYKDYEWSKFILNVFKYKIEKLDQSITSKGFVWKIINTEKNVIHYLIGTIHATSQAIAECPLFANILRKSSQIFTESGYCQKQMDVYNFDSKFYKDPTRFAIDDELKKAAFEKGIPIQGLDLPFPYENSLELSKRLINRHSKLKILQQRHYLTSIYGNILSIARETLPFCVAWHRGTLEEKINYDSEDRQRNMHWLRDAKLLDVSGEHYQGLLDLIKNSQTPSCIAVGLAHCLHEDPSALLNEFQKNGFSIERIDAKIEEVEAPEENFKDSWLQILYKE